jgi:hypothetical protein
MSDLIIIAAENRVRDARRILAGQEALVARLRLCGGDLETAQGLLAAFRTSLGLCEDNLSSLLQEQKSGDGVLL